MSRKMQLEIATKEHPCHVICMIRSEAPAQLLYRDGGWIGVWPLSRIDECHIVDVVRAERSGEIFNQIPQNQKYRRKK